MLLSQKSTRASLISARNHINPVDKKKHLQILVTLSALSSIISSVEGLDLLTIQISNVLGRVGESRTSVFIIKLLLATLIIIQPFRNISIKHFCVSLCSSTGCIAEFPQYYYPSDLCVNTHARIRGDTGYKCPYLL